MKTSSIVWLIVLLFVAGFSSGFGVGHRAGELSAMREYVPPGWLKACINDGGVHCQLVQDPAVWPCISEVK